MGFDSTMFALFWRNKAMKLNERYLAKTLNERYLAKILNERYVLLKKAKENNYILT